MRYVEAGGVRLSVIGLGTWQFGSREWGYGDDYAEREAVAVVHRALDLGVNLVDTAEVYAFGRAERIVGGALGDRRQEAFVATKVWPVMPVASVVERRGRASARRLGVDRIDLYQVHWSNPLVPVGATMDGMARLLQAGLVDHVGVSNFTLGQWQAAERSLGSPVLSNQVRYNLVDRRPERDLLPQAARHGRVVIAYSPLAQGLLSGKYDPDHRPSGGIRTGNPLFLPANLQRALPLVAALREVATAHHATPAQVALAWVVSHPNVVAIPGARSVAQVEANAAAADLELTDEERRRLTEASDAFRPLGAPQALARLVRDRLPF